MRAHCEALIKIAACVHYLFTCADFQIVIKNEMNVVGKKFFACGLLANRLQRACAHLEFVRSREHCAADGILANCIGYGSLLNYEIRQTFARSSIGRRQSGWTCADD